MEEDYIILSYGFVKYMGRNGAEILKKLRKQEGVKNVVTWILFCVAYLYLIC